MRPRRRPLLTVLVIWGIASIAFAAVLGGGPDSRARAQDQQPGPGEGRAEEGEVIWDRDCASCHGPTGDGTQWGPSLHDKGPAGVALAVSTGRMPVARLEPLARRDYRPGEIMEPGEPAYPPGQIEALVEYTRTFLGGPEVEPVETEGLHEARGQELFQLNCAACHSWSGRGGALTSGQLATSLADSTPTQVVQAMRTGIGTMPVFDPQTIDDDEAAAIAAYVERLQEPDTDGVLGLGLRGPFAEGAVAWLVGILGILIVTRWIGARR